MDVKQKLKHLKRRKINKDLKTIYAMIQLLKKSDGCVKLLEQIRINPKLIVKKNKNLHRADLEFYIPQIISYYLRNDLND